VGILEAASTYLSSLSAFARGLIVCAFVLMAGLLLMLVRTSPALASDSIHGQSNGANASPATAAAKTLEKTTEGNADSRGDTAGGKTGNGDDRTKASQGNLQKAMVSTGKVGSAGSANNSTQATGAGQVSGSGAAVGKGQVSAATASSGSGQVLAATGAPIAGGLLGGILFILGALGVRNRQR
jgi:hypothetical protein